MRKHFSIRIDDTLHELLKRVALKRNVRMSRYWIEALIEKLIREGEIKVQI